MFDPDFDENDIGEEIDRAEAYELFKELNPDAPDEEFDSWLKEQKYDI